MHSVPLVSVLMTAYNREEYLQEAVESVLASTFTNFEVVIVDDCSTDGTYLLLQQLAQRDSRIRLYTNAQNLGDYANRNRAAGYARGKYLKFVDSDDYLYPWGLQLLVDMMEAHPEAQWGLCTLFRNTFINKPYPYVLPPKGIYEYEYFGPNVFSKAPVSSIITKALFDKVGGFKPLRMVGDSEMWHRLALEHPLLLMPDGIIWYREHDKQEMSDYDKYYLKYEEISLYYLGHERCPLTAQQVAAVKKRRKGSLLRQSLFYTATFKFTEAQRFWNLLLFHWRYKRKALGGEDAGQTASYEPASNKKPVQAL